MAAAYSRCDLLMNTINNAGLKHGEACCIRVA